MSPGANHSDLDLLRRYSDARDPEAFAEITRRYARMVYSVALRVTGRPHDAEDIAQSCFLELARRSDEVRTSVGGWLHSLATSRATNAVRDRSTRLRHERQAAEAASGDFPELGWPDLAPVIDAAIASLQEEVRLPLVLHYLHGQSQQEIARALKISQPTVSRRLGAGVEQLRAALRARGVSAAVGVAAVAGLLNATAEATSATVVPASLQASLGKLAMAGIGPAPAASATPAGLAALGAKTPVAISTIVKWAVASAVASSALAVAVWLLLAWWRGSPLERRIASSESAAVVTRDAGDGRWHVRGVSPLQWGATQSGNTTVIGSLTEAMRSAGSDVDYTQLMGDSGIAFRTRWMTLESADIPDPFRGVRVVSNREIPLIERSTGWRVAMVTDFTPGRKDLREFASAVAASVRAGKSVIAEDTRESAAGLIFASDPDGTSLVVHEYGGPPAGRAVRLDEMGGGLMFLCERKTPVARRDAVVAALQKAVRDWNRPAELTPITSFQYGDSAWEAWLEQARNAPSMPPPLREKFQHVSYWTYDVLCDARYHAAIYLRRHAELFPPTSRASILAAADQYARLETERLADPCYRAVDGPWSVKTMQQWRATNAANPAVLARVRAIDAAAIRQIDEALRTMSGVQ